MVGVTRGSCQMTFNLVILDEFRFVNTNIWYENGKLVMELSSLTETTKSNIASLYQKMLQTQNVILSVGEIVTSAKLQQIVCTSEIGEMGLHLANYWNITKCAIHVSASYQLWCEIKQHLPDAF